MVRKPKKTRKSRKIAVRKRSPEKQLAATDYEALAHFRYRLRLFVAFADENAKKAGLTSQQFQTLLAIKGFSRRKPMFVGELAKLMLIKHHTTVELVDRMVKLELLRRTVDANDNRRVLVTLTKKGLRLLQKVAAVNFRHLGSSSRTLSRISRILS